MALFSSADQVPKTSQNPQQNQYLQADPNTKSDANTSWMNPTGNTGFNGGNQNAAQAQANPPSQVSNGTMLGSVASGNAMPSFGAAAPSREQLMQYSQSRGGNQLNDSSLNYWSDPNKWNELRQRGMQLQPGTDGSWYANKFLGNAEEFTGGAHQTAMNMWGFDPAEQSNNAGGNNQLMMLLQQLLGGGVGNQVNRGAQPYDPHAGKVNMPQQMGYAPPNGNGGFNPNHGGELAVESPTSYFGGGGIIDPATGQRRQPRLGEPQ